MQTVDTRPIKIWYISNTFLLRRSLPPLYTATGNGIPTNRSSSRCYYYRKFAYCSAIYPEGSDSAMAV